MAHIGIFFGTDTGRTRLVAKQIAKKLGDAAAAPVNIGRTTVADFLAWDPLILGTPPSAKGNSPACPPGWRRKAGRNSCPAWPAMTCRAR